MKNKKMDTFGVVMVALHAIANVMQLMWTVFLSLEQAQTGWGYGTDFEIAVLVPWLLEILCTPVVLAGTVYLICACFYPHRKKVMFGNLALYLLLVGQYLATNLFIWF